MSPLTCTNVLCVQRLPSASTYLNHQQFSSTSLGGSECHVIQFAELTGLEGTHETLPQADNKKGRGAVVVLSSDLRPQDNLQSSHTEQTAGMLLLFHQL